MSGEYGTQLGCQQWSRWLLTPGHSRGKPLLLRSQQGRSHLLCRRLCGVGPIPCVPVHVRLLPSPARENQHTNTDPDITRVGGPPVSTSSARPCSPQASSCARSAPTTTPNWATTSPPSASSSPPRSSPNPAFPPTPTNNPPAPSSNSPTTTSSAASSTTSRTTPPSTPAASSPRLP